MTHPRVKAGRAGFTPERLRADRELLKRLARILGTDAAVVGNRVEGERQIGSEDAALEFSVPLSWIGSSGQPLASQPLFRAEFVRGPRGWEMSSCRIVGSPKL